MAASISWAGVPSVIRGETSTEVVFSDKGVPIILITLTPKDSAHTQVEARQALPFVTRLLNNNVEACVSGRDK